jgi:hypothetical protein
MNGFAARLSRPASLIARLLFALGAAVLLIAAPLPYARAAVNLLSFTATWQDDNTILVAWETSSELDAVAFFLYRSESQSGPWDDYIDFEPAAGNDFTGATYSFVDNEVTRGVTYYYRLEELAANDTSSFHGPVTPGNGTSPATATATRAATGRPTATDRPGESSNPTATRQYTNTPPAASSGASASASLPAQTQTPAGSARTGQAASTPSSGLMVTTPTPIGGIPAPAPPTPTSGVTAPASPEGGEPQQKADAEAAETTILQQTPPAPTPSPTAQQVAAAPKETSQPLLDASTPQDASVPADETPTNKGPSSRLALLLGVGALAAAVILGGLVLLIWRWRSR